MMPDWMIGAGIEDFLLVGGTLLVGIGVWMYSPAAALIVVGLVLIGFGILLAGR